MAGIELNYKDITEIFKNNLKIENLVKSIQSIFLNYRFSSKIDYKPYFQRNYVWDEEKATYFIESVILGTEIPPLVLFQTKVTNEVIDGRQRYETIQRFIEDKFALRDDGLRSLKLLAGKRFSQLDDSIKDAFINTKLRILQCCVVNEPALSADKEDKIKKEIFRRYNSGIVPLHKEEIERAEYINDEFTKIVKAELYRNGELFDNVSILFLPKSKGNAQKRDKVNILLAKIRSLLALPYVPISNYAQYSSKSEIVSKYYYRKIATQDANKKLAEFTSIINMLIEFKRELGKCNDFLADNNLLHEVSYWALSIALNENVLIDCSHMPIFANSVCSANNIEYFWKNIDIVSRSSDHIFEPTGSHFYKSIIYRYTFISNYFFNTFGIDFSMYFKDKTSFKEVMSDDIAVSQVQRFKLNKTDPVSTTIYDIIHEMENSRFLIRPEYQRSEVTNTIKASYLLESILLGIKIPPIFIFKREDKIKEVIDGQQRLLTLLGFLGKAYVNESGEKEYSKKDRFRLTKLRILEELNGQNADTIDGKHIDRILDFPLDIVEINADQNRDFNNIDLFLRLNTKPYPIKENTFEMWNAYVKKDIVIEIKKIAENYEGFIFRPNDSRMKNEELITSLAYLDYKQRINSISPFDFVDIYIRNNRINARIKSKENITKFLSDISNSDDIEFMRSVGKVEQFAENVRLLINNDSSNLATLFAHRVRNRNYKTDQNFYLLWMMLSNKKPDEIEKDKEMLTTAISAIFSSSTKLPPGMDASEFTLLIKKIQ